MSLRPWPGQVECRGPRPGSGSPPSKRRASCPAWLPGRSGKQKCSDGDRAVAGRGGSCCMRPGASNGHRKRGSMTGAVVAAHLCRRRPYSAAFDHVFRIRLHRSFHWDDQSELQVTRHMLIETSLMVPRWRREVWFVKPPCSAKVGCVGVERLQKKVGFSPRAPLLAGAAQSGHIVFRDLVERGYTPLHDPFW